jgi:hypothetical protein
VKGKNGKYDCYIKRTTDNVSQIVLQASRWRVKTANTILQIPWKKLNLIQIHLHEVQIVQIHNARPEFVKNITAINQSESSIVI